METNEVFGHFSVENTIKKSGITAKSQSKFKAGGAKANGICFRCNSEEGCTGKCYFISINAVNVISDNTGKRTARSLNRIRFGNPGQTVALVTTPTYLII